jgi:hypothetical protein
MIAFPASLLAVGGSRTGLAPVNLLDVQLLSGDIYYWSDRAVNNIPAVITPSGNPASVNYLPWIESTGEIKLYRSLQASTCSFAIQNVSGDSMQRDIDRIARKSALEGAFFVYRIWAPDAQTPWLRMDGKLTVTNGNEEEIEIKGTSLPLDVTEVDALSMSYSETCQLEWASARCGSTQPTSCQNSFQTCQVVERYTGILNTFEKNYGEATSSVSTYAINRRRQI